MRNTIMIIILIVLSITFAGNSRADWQIDMDVYTHDAQSDTGKASSNLSLGTSSLSSEQYDNKVDTIALTGESVNAFFYHPEYKSNVQRLWRDFRGAGLPQEWGFEVQTSDIDKIINLKWKIEDQDNLHFILVDKENGNEIDMASVSEYSYTNESTAPKIFLLKVAKNDNSATVDNTSIADNDKNNNSNNVVTSGSGTNGSGGTRSTGGGCGYIKNINGNNNHRNNGGNIAMNMMILVIPLLLPFHQYVKRYAYNVINR